MKQKVRHYIERLQLLRPGDRVGVAVSGGADSIALLRVLLELRDELGLVLSVVHFNHKIRGADADEDERFVRELAGKFALSCHVASHDVPAYAEANRLSLETAARELRYQFFREDATSRQLDAVATAHTSEDQAETVVMNLVRGAGTQGMAGIFPRRPLAGAAHVVRPLLSTSRAEIVAFLEALGQPWRQDASNFDLKHTRNRVRHEIMPRLRALNPSLERTLADSAEVARAEQRYWDDLVAGTLPLVLRKAETGNSKLCEWSFDAEGLLRFPLAVQRRILRQLPAPELSLHEVEALLDLLCGEVGRSRQLEGGYVALRRKDDLLVQPGQSPQDYALSLAIPGEILVPALRMRFRAFFQEVGSGNSGYNRARFLEPQSLGPHLLVRNWRAGDRFWPAHARSPEKVKRLLQERRVTGIERALWPVMASGDEIVWMYGFGASQQHLAKGARAVVIEEEPLQA